MSLDFVVFLDAEGGDRNGPISEQYFEIQFERCLTDTNGSAPSINSAAHCSSRHSVFGIRTLNMSRFKKTARMSTGGVKRKSNKQRPHPEKSISLALAAKKELSSNQPSNEEEPRKTVANELASKNMEQ